MRPDRFSRWPGKRRQKSRNSIRRKGLAANSTRFTGMDARVGTRSLGISSNVPRRGQDDRPTSSPVHPRGRRRGDDWDYGRLGVCLGDGDRTVIQMTLDNVSSTPWAFASAVRIVGQSAGQSGFTVEDIRAFYAAEDAPFPANPGALLGSLVSNGELSTLCDEPAQVPSSKQRRLRRFILVDCPPEPGVKP